MGSHPGRLVGARRSWGVLVAASRPDRSLGRAAGAGHRVRIVPFPALPVAPGLPAWVAGEDGAARAEIEVARRQYAGHGDPAPDGVGLSGQVIGIMPTGKVKWFDADKGFGFLAQEGGADVHVRSSALPAGMTALKPGQKVEFDVADGRRGPQALRVTVLDAPPSIVAATRRPAEELHGLVDDMIKLLESKALPDLRRGRYPEKAIAGRIADVMRAVAAEFEA